MQSALPPALSVLRFSSPIVKVMAHPLAGANIDRGVEVEIRWKHRKQGG
jgi:hypothetical protein